MQVQVRLPRLSRYEPTILIDFYYIFLHSASRRGLSDTSNFKGLTDVGASRLFLVSGL
jgi:hypothetical protein